MNPSISRKNQKQKAITQIIRLILLCPNKFYTMIKIKGFFKQKCISEWACSKKAFESAIDKRFPEWKDGVRAGNSVTLFYKNQNKFVTTKKIKDDSSESQIFQIWENIQALRI